MLPSHFPSNVFRPGQAPVASRVRDNYAGEAINIPDFMGIANEYLAPEDAEKALRDLMSGGINQTDNAEIDMSEETVPGFKEDIKLLPHQILGRRWMREREDVEQKRMGGILADDMGLGKTIQTLTRIVEGRPCKSDRDDGWAAATLVVCPVALLAQWASEISKMAVGLTVVQHHGPNRASRPELLKRAHVVITTYTTIASEHATFKFDAKDESKSKNKKKAQSDDDSDSDDSVVFLGRTIANRKKPTTTKMKEKRDALFQVQWWRIVLDEAHNIKNRTTKSALACCDLEAKFRWCLTGTPVQNNIEELYSLIKFLRIKPLNDLTKFKDQIAKPLKNGRGASRAMRRLQVVLEKVMLRRQKDQILNGKPILILPARNVNIVHCEFDETEQAFYEELETKMDAAVNKLMEQEQTNYMSVLLLLLRLRQACNHPSLVSKDYQKDQEAVAPRLEKATADDDDSDELADMFGKLGVTQVRKCQMCQVDLANDADSGAYCVNCIAMAKKAKSCSGRPDSAKIRMILKLLREIDERSDREEKTIIFSQFTSMLDLIEPFLKDEGIAYVRYDGQMTKVKRDESLEKIRNSKRTRCILISFKAGSTGLNLTACNNVILTDMWWNPALEDQAFDRTHRFGQTRDVHIFKLMIEQTVEERILLLQERKRELARAALSGDKIKDLKLGMDDLLALFKYNRDDSDSEDE